MDGRPLELPEDIEGVLLLNIASYMGGVNLWASGTAAASYPPLDFPQSSCDGMLEVCWSQSFHICHTWSVLVHRGTT